MPDYNLEQQNQLLNEWNESLETGQPVTKRQAENMKSAADSSGIQAKRIVEYHPYVTTLVADPKEEEALGKEWVDSPSDVGKKVI